MPGSRSINVTNGKGLEYALARRFSELTDAHIVPSPSVIVARDCFHNLKQELKGRFQSSADMAVNHILKLEGVKAGDHSFTSIEIADDASGIRGDVRDVVLTGSNRELGISCKNNHRAFKHPRLSGSIDFVKKWGLDSEGCSREYWSAIKPIFEELRAIRELYPGIKWTDIESYQDRFYGPVLAAFENELLRFVEPSSPKASLVSKNFVSYVIGTQDFYKLIVTHNEVEIEGFNFQGSLKIAKSRYPEHVLGIDSFDGSRFSRTVRFDKGYTFNFRIHNASSRVEPSLKFDIQAIALPPAQVYNHHMDFLFPT